MLWVKTTKPTMADTEIDEQIYEGFELKDYSNPDKVKALIKYLA